MQFNILILGLITILFLTTGGVVDYWQSARHHGKNIPLWLDNYFGLFWLILYSGLLPILLVFSASNFNFSTAKFYIGFLLIGAVCWDLIYSLLDKKVLVDKVKDYWFWGGKDFGLSKSQIILWHIIRLSIAIILIII